MTNPFEALGIDPLATISQITERVRDLSEDADEPGRKQLRDLWEALTLHPRTRVTAAISTFIPETPAPEVAAPPLSRSRAQAGPLASLLDSLPIAGLVPTLSSARSAPPPPPPLSEDPIVQEEQR